MVFSLYRVCAIIVLIGLSNYGKAVAISEDVNTGLWTMELLNNLSKQMNEHDEKLNNQLQSLQQDLNAQKNLLKSEIKLLQGYNTDGLEVSGSEHKVQIVQKLKQTYARNCAEALQANDKDGIYQLYAHLPDTGFIAFEAYCMRDIFNGSVWTVFQRRQDGSVDFLRGWNEYKKGFINVSDSEFFLGLEKIHALIINAKPMRTELWIQMVDYEGAQRFAKYDNFVLGDENEKFALKSLGEYYGDAGDSMRYHEKQKFSTIDNDNDAAPGSCATTYTGAWWYYNCHESNLNGKYGDNRSQMGINWKAWRGLTYSLKSVFMAIRPISHK